MSQADYVNSPLAFLNDLIIPSVQGPQRFGDCMADFQRERFMLLVPALLALARGEKPSIGRFWFEATKGGSKDSDLACALLWLLSYTRRSLTCQLAAADQDQAAEMRKCAADVLRLNPWLSNRVTINNWKIIGDKTESTAEILAADQAGSHGARPDLLLFNELSHVTKREFAENLLDNCAKVSGVAVIATNAGVTGSWQYKWRQIAFSSPRWATHVWAKPSPWIDPEEIKEAERRNSQSRYLRLWWGRWVSGSGDAIDPEDVAAAVNASTLLVGRQTDWALAAGLDLSVKRDHSGFCVVARNGAGRLAVPFCNGWAPNPSTGRVDISQIEETIFSVNARFGLHHIFYDPHQAAYLAERLIKRGVKMVEYTFAGKNLDLLASTLMEVFREHNIDLPDNPELIADIGNLMIVDKSWGHKLEATHDAETGSHADRGIALALGCVAVRDAPLNCGAWGGFIDSGTGIAMTMRGLGTSSIGGSHYKETVRPSFYKPGGTRAGNQW
jgi:hypothetical protein